jgi:hypothetical protein
MISFLSRIGAPLAVASMGVACADKPFGPTLTDRWGGAGAELDATQSPPTLQPAEIPPAQFLLHRGRNGDFPSDVACAQ